MLGDTASCPLGIVGSGKSYSGLGLSFFFFWQPNTFYTEGVEHVCVRGKRGRAHYSMLLSLGKRKKKAQMPFWGLDGAKLYVVLGFHSRFFFLIIV